MMKQCRPKWSDDRTDREWQLLEATTPESAKQFGGPVEAPLQLPIPAWLTGEESMTHEVDHFETRQMQTENKAASFSNEDGSKLSVHSWWIYVILNLFNMYDVCF